MNIFWQDRKSGTKTQVNRHFVFGRTRIDTDLKKRYIALQLIKNGKDQSAIGTTD